MKIRLLSVSLLVFFLFILAGCINIGPTYKKPNLGITLPNSYQHAPKEKLLPKPNERWWEVFNDPYLNKLIDEALKNNLDIKKATSRILELQSQLAYTRADRFPKLEFQAQTMRQHQTITVMAPTPVSKTETSNIYNLSFAASFEIDLWGRLSKAEEAKRAELLNAKENRQTIAQSIVAETITIYLQIESLERRIKLTKKKIENYRQSLKIVKRRYERGLVSILDVKQAKRMLSQAKAALPSLEENLGMKQQQLAMLLGRYPKTSPPRVQPEDYFKHLTPVPPGLPSELLLRRPDIRAALAKLKALNAQVGVAKASRFPHITLTGSYGYTSTALDQLFRPESLLWNLALGMLEPIFDAGQLKANQKAAEARYQQGLVEYAKTVLTAFYEVESALLIREKELEKRKKILNLLREAKATEKVAKERYMRGLVNYLTVLESQRSTFQAEEELILVDLAIYTNRVSLHRALGGGWAKMSSDLTKKPNL
ncbi:MAG: transporter [Spirochaetes bacterium]|nr:MAG: transporter [Spirochaetota bacterium]